LVIVRKDSPLLQTKNLEALFAVSTSQGQTQFTDIVTDSRKASTGSLFFAIQGELVDGHSYIESALSKGARGIVYQTDKLTPTAQKAISDAGVWSLGTTDSLAALRTLAGAYRKEFQMPVIAVIGSVGKTSTKELIAAMLKGKFPSVAKTLGSQNGFLGIPMTILAWDGGLDAAVVEIGIDAVGAMEQHIELVLPTMTVLTRTGPEHLHQLVDEKTATHEECLGLMGTIKAGGKIIVNGVDPGAFAWWQKTIPPAKQARRYAIGADPSADFSATTNSNQITIRDRENQTRTFALPIPGVHQAANFLAAYSAMRTLNLTDAEIKKGLSAFKGAAGRTEIHALKNGGILIADHYNSNPTSLRAAVQLLQETSEKTKLPSVAILADMLELGDQEESYHREMAGVIQSAQIKRVFLTGTRMKWLHDELKKIGFSGLCTFELDRNRLMTGLRNETTNSKAVILVKGSRSMKLEEVLPIYER
jgi:UDP-N-acetylmuramoyl-tripeptide--D-alanyl-D-alanine ligase